MTRRRWIMLGAAALAAVVVLGGATVAVIYGLRDRYRVPTAELFGTPTPLISLSPTPSPTPPPPGTDITGPLNLLIVGVDTREDDPTWEPHADAVTILHVPRGLKTAYMFSLPGTSSSTSRSSPSPATGAGTRSSRTR
ncbi:hypothetical protein [Phytohabitans flavus]|uniref:hypothetical protein n=1 Tax=Phytohabitans flavus TaxID=1076124 RepID=UPI00366A822C